MKHRLKHAEQIRLLKMENKRLTARVAELETELMQHTQKAWADSAAALAANAGPVAAELSR